MKIPYIDREVIKITKNGRWLADGEEMTHERTRKLFAKSLHRESGDYVIKVGREKKTISVEDTAYFISSVTGSPASGYEVHIQDVGVQDLDPMTLSYSPDRLTCVIVTPTSYKEPARFLSGAYHEILKNVEQDDKGFYLTIKGKKIYLQSP